MRPAKLADLPRIREVRGGTTENRLTDTGAVTEPEVRWYLDEGVFLVSQDETDVQGFVCANPQTGYLWALFVIDAAQGRGHGGGLHDAAMSRLRDFGHRQSFLSTGTGTKAEGFYEAKGWRRMGVNLKGDAVYRLWL